MVTILLPQNKNQHWPQARNAALDLLESFESIAIIGWVSCGQPIDIFTQEERLKSQRAGAKKRMHCVSARLNERREYP